MALMMKKRRDFAMTEMLTITQDFSTPYMDRYDADKRALLRTEEYRKKHRAYYQATRNAKLEINPKPHCKVFSGREEWAYENI